MAMTETKQTAAMDFRPQGVMTVYTPKLRMTVEQAEKAMRAVESGFYVIVSSANVVASMAVFDALTVLERENYHNDREARRWARQTKRQLDEYETRMRIRLQDASRRMGCVGEDGRDKFTLWLDMTDGVNEEMHPYIERLYYAVKMCMDRHRTPHSETLARMWTAEMMLQFAVRQFDLLFEEQKRDCGGVSVRQTFISGSLQGQHQCWRHAVEAIDLRLCPKDAPNVELTEDENIRNGIRAIAVRLDDYNMYNRAGAYAVGLNREIVSEEDLRECGLQQ